MTLLAVHESGAAAESKASTAQKLQWKQLPPIPDREGFAGAFAGVSHGALIVAGGANITAKQWADDFVKTWYDSIFVLEEPSGEWKKLDAADGESTSRLPRPLGYGVSMSTADGLICLGGSDAKRHYADAFRLEWKQGRMTSTALPDLPKPCANFCGALVGDVIYVAGGIETPTATVALKTFWALDLTAKPLRWKELEPWPGPERMLSVAGAHNGSFYLFSGTKLRAGADGKPVRTFLRDAYRFTPSTGWERLADLPRPAVAAPTPAPLVNDSSLLMVSGDDGTKVDFQPVTQHPGFPRDVLAFDTRTGKWSNAGEAPFSRATAPCVFWGGRYVVPNGEVRPRVRTPEVWAVSSTPP